MGLPNTDRFSPELWA